MPPEPPEQAGRSLYERLEISGMRSQLLRRSADLKKNISGSQKYLDVLREMSAVVRGGERLSNLNSSSSLLEYRTPSSSLRCPWSSHTELEIIRFVFYSHVVLKSFLCIENYLPQPVRKGEVIIAFGRRRCWTRHKRRPLCTMTSQREIEGIVSRLTG